MSFRRKLISVLALTFILVAFNVVATAQETPSADKPDAMRKDGKRGKQGRKGMRGKRGREGRHGKRGRRGRRGGNRALRGITLNDGQKQQLQTLFKSKRGEKRPQNEEFRELARAKRSGLATEAQTKRFNELRESMRANRKAEREKMSQSIRSILTPEQQTQYDKNIAEGKARMEERKKRHEERKKVRGDRKNKSSKTPTP